MKQLVFVGALAVIAACFPVAAQQQASDHAAHHPASAAASSPTPALTDGEVRKIDKAQAKITLRHGPIAHLEMPSMTMVFRVADPTMLDAISEGDKVQFAADKVNGVFTVTSIKPVK